jgi:large subunit ribosomal protein L4
MPKVNVFDLQGKKVGTIELPKEIFAAKVNRELMAQAVRVYLANQRKSGAKAKSRGEIKGSTRKIWRQKGTGRARHGDRYAPIFVGGGVAHGPTGKENWKKRLTKKMRRNALFSALTVKLKNQEILVVKGLEKVEPKTKEMAKIMKNLKFKMKNGKLETKVLVILPEVLENVIRAGRNIANLSLSQANLLNPYEVLKEGTLVLMKESVGKLEENYLKKAK